MEEKDWRVHNSSEVIIRKKDSSVQKSWFLVPHRCAFLAQMGGSQSLPRARQSQTVPKRRKLQKVRKRIAGSNLFGQQATT